MSSGRAKIILLEDNEAVIKSCIKARSPNLRHIPRVHRVNVDTLFERILMDPGIFIKFIGTKWQIADIFTKGSFSAPTWKFLCNLFMIGKTSEFTILSKL